MGQKLWKVRRGRRQLDNERAVVTRGYAKAFGSLLGRRNLGSVGDGANELLVL